MIVLFYTELSVQLGSARVGCTAENVNVVMNKLLFADNICVFGL